MESHIKTGRVFLQSHKPGKKWKPVLLSVFPASNSGVGRLEIQYSGGGAGGDHGTRRPHGEKKLKVVRLSELLSVLKLPPNAEACPEDNMSAFCVEMQDRTLVFAAEKKESVLWVEKLCHYTFQKGGDSSSVQLHMEENEIYASSEQVADFWTVIQRTEAATRCGLQGAYWLEVGQEALKLKEPQKKNLVQEWPYELLRRYGKDKLMFTIEAGRRCNTGPGTFTFETPQAEKIFSLIQSFIKRKTSPLPNEVDGSIISIPTEKRLRTSDRKSPVMENTPDDSLKSGAPAPITLMPLPSLPTHDSPSAGRRNTPVDAIYADPVDCVPSAVRREPATALYVDPVSVLPLKPPGLTVTSLPTSQAPSLSLQGEPMDSEYSEVYDRVSPNRSNPGDPPSERTARRPAGEPIYDDPMSNTEQPAKQAEPDPFAHLYAKVCKRGRSPSPSPKTVDFTHDENDVISENMGII
ncbi:unnamed protein product [Ophioblennius macclurei]